MLMQVQKRTEPVPLHTGVIFTTITISIEILEFCRAKQNTNPIYRDNFQQQKYHIFNSNYLKKTKSRFFHTRCNK